MSFVVNLVLGLIFGLGLVISGMVDPAKVQIDLATHRVQVESASADAEELADAIKDAGYTPVLASPAVAAMSAKPAGSCCGCR